MEKNEVRNQAIISHNCDKNSDDFMKEKYIQMTFILPYWQDDWYFRKW